MTGAWTALFGQSQKRLLRWESHACYLCDTRLCSRQEYCCVTLNVFLYASQSWTATNAKDESPWQVHLNPVEAGGLRGDSKGGSSFRDQPIELDSRSFDQSRTEQLSLEESGDLSEPRQSPHPIWQARRGYRGGWGVSVPFMEVSPLA